MIQRLRPAHVVRADDGEANAQTVLDYGTALAGATGSRRIDVVLA